MTTSGQVLAVHEPMQLMLKPGGVPLKLMQPRVHVSTSPQVIVSQVPQSAAQLMQVSNPPAASQTPFPQNEQTPQSTSQLAQSSVTSQRPSPQPLQMPQSVEHVKQSSLVMLQVPSPQLSHSPQSGVQVRQSSPSSGSQ